MNRYSRAASTLAVPASLLLAIASASAQQTAPPPSRLGATAIAASDTTVDARIMAEIRNHERATSDLFHITSTIGPRLTGSDRLLRANTWAESTFKARGFTNVHSEQYEFGPSWTRGIASARLLNGNGATISLAQVAWSPATKGTVRADAILIDGKTVADIDALAGHFKGHIVLVGSLPRVGQNGVDSVAFAGMLQRLDAALTTEVPVAMLRSSGRNEGLTMTGGPHWRFSFPTTPVPFAWVANRDFALMAGMLQRGKPVSLELNLPGARSATPARTLNTIAEIRGTEHPEEVVIIGGHLDSWDLGTGATDNGTGAVAVMEAARAINALGLKPKRTIRVILFSGEEQGEIGSTAYVKAHAAELKDIQGVLVHDLGTGKVRGWALQGREDARRIMASAIASMNDMGVRELPLELGDDSDHAPFAKMGVPAFFAVQDTLDYFTTTHHSEFDTYDRVRPDDLREGAMVIAVTAWNLANMPERLPHIGPRAR